MHYENIWSKEDEDHAEQIWTQLATSRMAPKAWSQAQPREWAIVLQTEASEVLSHCVFNLLRGIASIASWWIYLLHEGFSNNFPEYNWPTISSFVPVVLL